MKNGTRFILIVLYKEILEYGMLDVLTCTAVKGAVIFCTCCPVTWQQKYEIFVVPLSSFSEPRILYEHFISLFQWETSRG